MNDLKIRNGQTNPKEDPYDASFVEFILTRTLQRLSARTISHHLCFKGGTMLRRMIFGKTYRRSGDLDFTLARPAVSDVSAAIQKISASIPGGAPDLSLHHDPVSDVHIAPHGNTHILSVCGVSPDGRMGAIKVEIDHRADPILPSTLMTQRSDLGTDLTVRCLRIEEIIGEKIRASYQRIRLRDLYDLAALSRITFSHDLVRKIAILKMWEAPLHAIPFSGGNFRGEIERRVITGSYDANKAELAPFLNGNDRLEIREFASIVSNQYQFLGGTSALERRVATDLKREDIEAFEKLRREARELASQ